MRGCRAAGLAAMLWAAAALPVRADVDAYLGKTIATVRVTVEGRPIDDAQLTALVETRRGQPLSMMEVRESITHLFSSGRYENVVVHAVEETGGVALVYDLLPLHPVTRIVFTGDVDAVGVDTGELRRAIVERYGDAPSPGRVTEIARIVEERLGSRGYLAARATPRAELEHDPDRATLIVALNAGLRTRIGDIQVVGLAGPAAAGLLARLRIAPQAPYEPEAIDGRVAEYIADRRSDGYFETRLMVTPRLDDDAALANLIVAVVPGSRVRVVFAGDPLPEEERERLVPIATEGSADEDLLEDSRNRIEEYLRAQGYRDAAAPYTRETSEDELRITFTIRRGPQYRVAGVEATGHASMPSTDITPLLSLRVGQPFETARLEADTSAIESLYRRQGFAAIAVEPAVEPQPRAGEPDVPVLVRLQIVEGPRTLVETVQFDGNRSLGDDLLSAGLGLAPGRPFFVTQMALDRDAVQLKYADLGFHSAAVEASPAFTPDGEAVDVVFTINEGPQFFVDHVVIVGNDRIDRETIARELQFASGDPLSLAAVNESQRRLAALGLFRRVRITQVGHGQETLRDVLVSLDESPATSIAYGPGIEVVPRTRRTGPDNVAEQTVEFAPRGFFEIGRRNLFGKNRSVNLFTRLSLRSRDSVLFDEGGETPTTEASAFGFAEYRVLGTFREPRVFDWPADALLTAVTEQQSRSSFNFARRAFSADLIRRLTRFVSVTGNYQIQRTELFDEQINPEDRLLIDRLFPQVRLSSFSSSLVRDTRDDQIDPSFGTYMSANTQAAGRRIGSEVGLLKTYLTAQLFQTVPRTGGLIFAASGRIGVATAFTREVARLDAGGAPVFGADGQPLVDLLEDLPASERFFAGGDTTVRGFALDQLGTRDTIDADGFPIGGNALVILNAELRVPLAGGLGAVGFFDTGNVFARTRAIDLGELRSAVGFGVRYQSPVGPIRVDIGFKLNPREIVPGHPESPRAVHISLGQAF